MKIKVTLSDFANGLSIVKDLFAAYKALSIALGGTISAYIATMSAASPQVVWAFIGVSIIGTGYGVAPIVLKTLRRLKSRNTIEEAGNFSTIYNHVTIDISNDGKKAFFTQRRLVKCLVDGVRFYRYQFFPPRRCSKIEHDIGTITSLDTPDTTEVTVEFKSPLKANSTQLMTLTAEMIDIFPTKDETWTFSKYYMGTEAYTLQMFFPFKRFPSNYSAEILEGDKKISLNDNLKENVQRRKKPSLILNVPELKDGQDLYLYFKW